MWEDLKGGKRREKCCTLNVLLKNKQKMKHIDTKKRKGKFITNDTESLLCT